VKFNSPYYKLLCSLGVAEIITILYQSVYMCLCLFFGLQVEVGFGPEPWVFDPNRIRTRTLKSDFYLQVGTSGACPIVPVALDHFVAAVGWFCWSLEYSHDALIATDRFVAVVFVVQLKFLFTPRRVIIISVCVWIVQIGIESPLFVGYIPVATLSMSFQTTTSTGMPTRNCTI